MPLLERFTFKDQQAWSSTAAHFRAVLIRPLLAYASFTTTSFVAPDMAEIRDARKRGVSIELSAACRVYHGPGTDDYITPSMHGVGLGEPLDNVHPVTYKGCAEWWL